MNTYAPTSTGEPAAALQPKPKLARKPALPALTGLRTLLALTIVLFHFTPSGLRWNAHPWLSLYPLIDIGYVFVSFFFLISGFILAYNYADRPQPLNALDFWVARFSRLYPVYLLTMIVSIPMLFTEFHVRSLKDFWEGTLATPLLIQGFFPNLATFWMTVTWTLSCEVALYILFPWLMRLQWPRSASKLTAMALGLWAVGLIPHMLYIWLNPDHLPGMADRYSGGFWIQFLKFTPLPYLCTFLAGLTLGRLQDALKFQVRGRMIAGLIGFTAVWFVAYHLADKLPYIMIHGGLLSPLFALIILGLSGPSPLASVFAIRPLVAVGTSTYCLYLLHFNVFMLIHQYKVPERLHVAKLDPWISYVFVVAFAMAVRRWVEHPMQLVIKAWWERHRARQKSASADASAVATARG
ncbi:MAG: acyltransferase [Acidobacteriaceae bacterium]|nr:acyltransferase [Acidobacteriaceae bacterium]